MKKIIILLLFLTHLLTTIDAIAQVSGDNDPTFYPVTGANTDVLSMAIQSDGKTIIGGGFTIYDDSTRSRIARLNTNGTLDTSFNPGMGANDSVSSISIQSDGKIVLGGAFTGYNGSSKNYLVRLNINGTLDETFNVGTGVNNWVNSTVIQSDGKIIIGGFFQLITALPETT